jgi:hypothetical protein
MPPLKTNWLGKPQINFVYPVSEESRETASVTRAHIIIQWLRKCVCVSLQRRQNIPWALTSPSLILHLPLA